MHILLHADIFMQLYTHVSIHTFVHALYTCTYKYKYKYKYVHARIICTQILNMHAMHPHILCTYMHVISNAYIETHNKLKAAP